MKLSTNLKRGKRFPNTVHNANDVIGIIVTEYSLPVRLSEKTE